MITVLVAVLGLASCGGGSDHDADGPVLSMKGERVTSTTSPEASSTTTIAAVGGGGPVSSPGQSSATVSAGTVPAVVGTSHGAAEQQLAAQGLRSLTLRVDDWRTPRDTVLSQDPAPGTSLPAGSIVTFRISSGPVDAFVPVVSGQCIGDAQARLTAAGFPSQVFYRVSNTVKFHRIISSDPVGVSLRQGSMVTLYVSTNQVQDGCS